MPETVLEPQETQGTQEEMLGTLANLAKGQINAKELAIFRGKLTETKVLLSPEEKELLIASTESRIAERARLYYFQHVQKIGDHVASLLESFQKYGMLAVAQKINQRVQIRCNKAMQIPIQDDVLLELARLYLQLQGQSILSITVDQNETLLSSSLRDHEPILGSRMEK